MREPFEGLPEGSLVLGIETSCDETAASVVRDGTEILSSVVSSQVDLHARYGGVVPEVASRAHTELLVPVTAQALVEAGVAGKDIAAVAATTGPGLVGALLVGVSAAKALALTWGVPFVSVNHLEAHLYAALLEEPDLEFPLVVLLVSGGHTMLVEMTDHGEYRLLGETLDDAAGEAFDKVARFLGLGYPGGPAIDTAALSGDPTAIRFPRAMIDDGLDFSFSGLKTAVVNHVRANPDALPVRIPAGTFGPNRPERDLVVSPQQMVDVSTVQFRSDFRMARDLLDHPGVMRAPSMILKYYVFHCGQTATVRAEGLCVRVNP